MSARSVWHLVAEISNPAPEPFMVVRVDTSVMVDGGVEGTVVSLHMQREDAERVAHEFDDGLLH